MINGLIQEEDTTLVNIYALNIRAPKYIKLILTDIKGEIISDTVRVGDFNTSLTSMERSSRQKINKETAPLNVIQDHFDLIDIFLNLIDIQRTKLKHGQRT